MSFERGVVLIVLIQVAVVANNRSMNELPKVDGLLSYRTDDRKLYIEEKSKWKALATQGEVRNVCSCTVLQMKIVSVFCIKLMYHHWWLMDALSWMIAHCC